MQCLLLYKTLFLIVKSALLQQSNSYNSSIFSVFIGESSSLLAGWKITKEVICTI